MFGHEFREFRLECLREVLIDDLRIRKETNRIRKAIEEQELSFFDYANIDYADKLIDDKYSILEFTILKNKEKVFQHLLEGSWKDKMQNLIKSKPDKYYAIASKANSTFFKMHVQKLFLELNLINRDDLNNLNKILNVQLNVFAVGNLNPGKYLIPIIKDYLDPMDELVEKKYNVSSIHVDSERDNPRIRCVSPSFLPY